MSIGLVYSASPANGTELEARLAGIPLANDPIFSERINAAKFPSLQAAVTEAQASNACLVIADTLTTVAAPIEVTSAPLVIEGVGINRSIIRATAAMESVFLFDDAAQNNRFDFRNLYIDCNGLADYGIKSDKLAHTTAYRVRVSGALLAGFRAGFGWDNDFIACEASNNVGDGWYLTVSDANAVNLIGCKAFLNNGLGVRVKSGHLVNIIGCTLETNKKGGIYSTTGVTLNVVNTYFEGNAENGLTFTTPAKTVKADIIVNGSATEDALSHAFAHRAVRVEGCYTLATNLEQFVWTGGAEGLSLIGNGCGATSVPLVGIYGDTTYAQAPVTLADRNNRGFSKLVTADSVVAGKTVAVSGWDSDATTHRNYITDDVLRYASLGSSGGGSIRRGGASYSGSETFEITGAAASDAFGVSLDMADYPELQGQLVTLSVLAKTSAISSGYALYISSLGLSTTSAASSTDWGLREFAAILPTTGTVKFGFRKTGAVGSESDVVTFTRPVLAVAGVPRTAFYASPEPPRRVKSSAPTTGTWAVGDFVWNTAPSADGTLGWVCTAAGAPGTWVAVGLLTATDLTDLTDGGATALHKHALSGINGGVATGTGYVLPDLKVGKAVATFGGQVVLIDDGGTERWAMGIPHSVAGREWVVVDTVTGTIRISVDPGTGVVTLTSGATVAGALKHTGGTAGFFNVTPVARPAALTQTYSTADRTLGAYTPDVESTVYTGATDGEAKLADLNALRLAYENLRSFVEDLAQHHNALVDDLQTLGLEQ